MKTVAVAAITPSEASPAPWSHSAMNESRCGKAVVTRVPPATVVLALAGEHDITTALSVEGTAADQLPGCDRLVVDLTEATFIDSSVINALARLARQARSRGVTFQVVAPAGSHVRRVLELMALEGHLGCVDALREGER